MKKVMQEFPDNDLERGIVGDCLRAAVASILDLPRSSVPHYLHLHWPDTDKANLEFDRFIARHGYMLLVLPGSVFMSLVRENDVQCYHLIFGIASSNGDTAPHACVGLNGRIVHDPNPMKPGLMGAIDDWQIGVFVSLFTKSKTASIRSVATPAAMARRGIQINTIGQDGHN